MTRISTIKATVILTSIFLALSFSLDAQKLKIPNGNMGSGGESGTIQYMCYDPTTPELSVTIKNNPGTATHTDRIRLKDARLTGFGRNRTTLNDPLEFSNIIIPKGESVTLTYQFSPSTWDFILNNKVVNSKIELIFSVTYSIEERVASNIRTIGDTWRWSDDKDSPKRTMKWNEPASCSNTLRSTTTTSDKITISPNPSKGNISIDYNLEKESHVSAFLYNAVGQQVKTIINDEIQAQGNQKINISIEDLDAGIYYFIIRDGNRTRTEKIVKI